MEIIKLFFYFFWIDGRINQATTERVLLPSRTHTHTREQVLGRPSKRRPTWLCDESADQMRPAHVFDEDINISIYTPSGHSVFFFLFFLSFIDSAVLQSDLSQILQQKTQTHLDCGNIRT